MIGIRRLRRAEAVPWLLVAAVFVVLSVLIGASIASFASVADAHARTTLSVSSSVTYRGLSLTRLLTDNGTVAFTIYLRVDDPSSRSLSFFTLGYRIWLEDAPVEAGLSGIARTPADVTHRNATGTHAFFLAFDGSVQTKPYPVPAGGNATFPFNLNLTRKSNADRFAAVQNITEYAVNILGGTSHIVWNVWVLVNLDIGGIPPPASVSEATYFSAISRIQFTEGVDFGQGVGVGGP
jgi:hypothetical protein